MVGLADLEKPLDPALEYFDATPSIEQLAKKLAEIQKMLLIQTTINASLTQHVRDLWDRVDGLEGKGKSSIILPERLNS